MISAPAFKVQATHLFLGLDTFDGGVHAKTYTGRY
jgi:hypothetical protein